MSVPCTDNGDGLSSLLWRQAAEEALDPTLAELDLIRPDVNHRDLSVSNTASGIRQSENLLVDITELPPWGPELIVKPTNEDALDSYQSLPQSLDLEKLFICDELSFTGRGTKSIIGGDGVDREGPLQLRRSATPAITDRIIISKPKRRLQRRAVHVLKTWYDDHLDHPYASTAEVADLMQHSGLSRNQVTNWLANKRRRVRQIGGAGKNSRPPSRATPSPGSDMWTPTHTPFERWRNSPPEEEPNDMSLVRQAAATQTFPPLTYHHGFSDDSDASTSMLLLPPATSSQTSRSSSFEFDMASSMSSRGYRRRRSRKTNIQERVIHRFQCTFCTASFKTKYDWARHEKSLHLSLEAWVCCQTEIQATIQAEDGAGACAYCGAADPGPEHAGTHAFASCRTQDVESRTFVRKDHLVQHLRNMHRSNFAAEMQDWRTSWEESVVSRCGFCSETFSTWDHRVQHLAGHFRDNVSMSSWQGDWGFEPHVQAQLEQAMPPYLIDWERNTMDPFVVEPGPDRFPWDDFAGLQSGASADQANPFSGLEHPPTTEHHSAVEYDWYGTENTMENRLAQYVQQQLGAGLPFPSDADLQNYARLVVYEDFDPLNTTFADNPQWLAAFKQRHGFV